MSVWSALSARTARVELCWLGGESYFTPVLFCFGISTCCFAVSSHFPLRLPRSEGELGGGFFFPSTRSRVLSLGRFDCRSPLGRGEFRTGKFHLLLYCQFRFPLPAFAFLTPYGHLGFFLDWGYYTGNFSLLSFGPFFVCVLVYVYLASAFFRIS